MMNKDLSQSEPDLIWNELVHDLWTRRLQSLNDGSFNEFKQTTGKYGFSEAASRKQNSLADDLASAAAESCDRPSVTDVEGKRR